MPTFSPQPVDAIDAAARRAFNRYCDLIGLAAVMELHSLNLRTLERINGSQRYLPPGLAREAAEHIDAHLNRPDLARDLHAWADQCDADRREGR